MSVEMQTPPGQGWRSAELVSAGSLDEPQITKSGRGCSTKSGPVPLGHVAAVLVNPIARQTGRPLPFPEAGA
jgi:hypothetical protein